MLYQATLGSVKKTLSIDQSYLENMDRMTWKDKQKTGSRFALQLQVHISEQLLVTLCGDSSNNLAVFPTQKYSQNARSGLAL